MSAPCPTLGFRLAFTIVPHVGASRQEALRREFLDALAMYGLACEETGDTAFDYTITGDGIQATESDRERVVAWLDHQPDVAGHRAGPLTDVSERG